MSDDRQEECMYQKLMLILFAALAIYALSIGPVIGYYYASSPE